MYYGGFHGAWCWDRVIPELERLGHAAVAVDLPGHGDRRHETAPTNFESRTGAIVDVVQPGDVLVGHSGGGFDITHAANAVPDLVSHVCHLAARLPREGRTWPESMAMRADGTMGDYDAAGVAPKLLVGRLPRSFILCLQDRAQERWYADLVAERLGVDQLTIDASHSPFLSRPAELAELLVEATNTKPVRPLQPD